MSAAIKATSLMPAAAAAPAAASDNNVERKVPASNAPPPDVLSSANPQEESFSCSSCLSAFFCGLWSCLCSIAACFDTYILSCFRSEAKKETLAQRINGQLDHIYSQELALWQAWDKAETFACRIVIVVKFERGDEVGTKKHKTLYTATFFSKTNQFVTRFFQVLKQNVTDDARFTSFKTVFAYAFHNKEKSLVCKLSEYTFCATSSHPCFATTVHVGKQAIQTALEASDALQQVVLIDDLVNERNELVKAPSLKKLERQQKQSLI